MRYSPCAIPYRNSGPINSQHIKTLSPRYQVTIETVPRTIKYKKRPNQFMNNNLIDVQHIKKVYNTEKQKIKLGLLNIVEYR